MIDLDGETRRKVFFRYPPPMDELTYSGDDDQPRSIRSSAYYLWWAYLKENEDYLACCENGGSGPMENLYRDFGDTRGKDFGRWWKQTGWKLFCEPDREPIVDHQEIPDSFDPKTHKLVSIPFIGDMDRTLAELRELLKEHFASARQRMRDEGNSARSPFVPLYPVRSKPDSQALTDRLQTWRIYKNDKTADPLRVAKELGIYSPALHRKHDVDYEDNIERKIKDYLREARILIRNVGLGRFPDFEDTSPEALKRKAAIKARNERRRRLEKMESKALKS